MKKIHLYKESVQSLTHPGYIRMYCGVEIRKDFSDSLNTVYKDGDISKTTCKRCLYSYGSATNKDNKVKCGNCKKMLVK